LSSFLNVRPMFESHIKGGQSGGGVSHSRSFYDASTQNQLVHTSQ
jgi:hypothetical protein